ncbi:OLC1v1034063C1 [Oldenlandia corymbosa var. corymbosa]|uniref:OLC1v1034063C1 n=1 Tax=Oldenlandia corymbosa var. corymbosa TaxID=529605 RepID=A0AAV1CQZ0_OLDCO|nr:OLC1v1034063C1 [Oldenlandia corymbosa var. corymbosa]
MFGANSECIMELPHNESNLLLRMGDRVTSDVVVRLRTEEGRDDWVYCHSQVLVNKSKYFAERLSDSWPTCQILDSRNCVEVYCEESDFDSHVNILRLFYVPIDGSVTDMWHGVRNAIGILKVACKLGCPEIITICVEYLEAVPWEESEEEEILKIIPGLGSSVEPILARLQPVDHSAILKIFLSALQLATSSPPRQMTDLKTSAQEQLEYMLTEDDDAPILVADDKIKIEVLQSVKRIFTRFKKLVESLLCDQQESVSKADEIQLFHLHLADLLWSCQILAKLECVKDFVYNWMELSESTIKVVELANPALETKLKVLEITAKVIEAIGYGTVVLPATKRFQMLKVWLPFARLMKPLTDSVITDDDNHLMVKGDSEIWQSLESAFVSLILTLPSADQAEILTEWLSCEHVRYPDLTEAFEVWCYRSKVAKRRLALVVDENGTTDMT